MEMIFVDTIVRRSQRGIVMVDGLIHFRHAAKKAASLSAGTFTRSDPGGRPREVMLPAPVILGPELQPVRSSTDGYSVTNPGCAVGFRVGPRRRVRRVCESAIHGYVLKYREAGVLCTPA